MADEKSSDDKDLTDLAIGAVRYGFLGYAVEKALTETDRQELQRLCDGFKQNAMELSDVGDEEIGNLLTSVTCARAEGRDSVEIKF